MRKLTVAELNELIGQLPSEINLKSMAHTNKNIERYANPEERRKASEHKKKMWSDEDKRGELTAAMKASWESNEQRARASEAATARWAEEEKAAKLKASMNARFAERHAEEAVAFEAALKAPVMGKGPRLSQYVNVAATARQYQLQLGHFRHYMMKNHPDKISPQGVKGPRK